MTLRIIQNLEQGTPAWHAQRRGIVTASVVGQLITKGAPDPLTVSCTKCSVPADSPCISTARKLPTPIKTIHDERNQKASELPPVYKVASTDTSRALVATLVAERITGWGEEVFENRDMMRGTLSEPFARDIYAEYSPEPVTEVGFMVREEPGFKLGYSPDGLVGDNGLIEIKSPRQKTHLNTILNNEVPIYNMAQVQAGLLVSGREWLDFISYCGGMPLFVKRVTPNQAWFNAITSAVQLFEQTAAEMIERYTENTAGMPLTERIDLFPEMDIAA